MNADALAIWNGLVRMRDETMADQLREALAWLDRAEKGLWNPHDGHYVEGGNFHGSFIHAEPCRYCAFRATNSHANDGETT